MTVVDDDDDDDLDFKMSYSKKKLVLDYHAKRNNFV